MREPLRLRHDPEAPADLRRALDAEARFALPHDLARVKAGLTAAVAAGVRPERSAGWSGPGLVTGAVILAAVGAYSLWGHAPPAPASARVEATAPTASTPDQTAPASLAVAASDRVK
ncbi:MAG: hypothetical protein KC933_40435, partial [Myxococcales bacterium]|nr:hypothetical protein [Myxococcales bacterium]